MDLGNSLQRADKVTCPPAWGIWGFTVWNSQRLAACLNLDFWQCDDEQRQALLKPIYWLNLWSGALLIPREEQD